MPETGFKTSPVTATGDHRLEGFHETPKTVREAAPDSGGAREVLLLRTA